MERYEEALECYEEIDIEEMARSMDFETAEGAPIIPGAYMQKEFLQYEAGDKDGALESLKEAVRLDPNNRNYRDIEAMLSEVVELRRGTGNKVQGHLPPFSDYKSRSNVGFSHLDQAYG